MFNLWNKMNCSIIQSNKIVFMYDTYTKLSCFLFVFYTGWAKIRTSPYSVRQNFNTPHWAMAFLHTLTMTGGNSVSTFLPDGSDGTEYDEKSSTGRNSMPPKILSCELTASTAVCGREITAFYCNLFVNNLINKYFE